MSNTAWINLMTFSNPKLTVRTAAEHFAAEGYDKPRTLVISSLKTLPGPVLPLIAEFKLKGSDWVYRMEGSRNGDWVVRVQSKVTA